MQVGAKYVEEVKSADTILTVPTIGVGSEEFKIDNVQLKVWDLSGQTAYQGTWKYYYETVNGIVFVLDSSNKEQLDDVRDMLHQVLSETHDHKLPILIFANK